MTTPATTAPRSATGAVRRAAGAALVLLVTAFGLTWHLVPAQAVAPGASEEAG
jgi:hypothetical protein